MKDVNNWDDPVPYEKIKSFYDCPISTSISQIQTMMTEEYNHQVLKAIGQIGIEIDEQGLVQALNQDRRRYEEAYQAGYSACKKEYEDRMLQIAKLTGVYLESEDE
jgi:hypothetical protein